MHNFILVRLIDTINYKIHLFKQDVESVIVDENNITNISNQLTNNETPYQLMLIFAEIEGVAKIDIFDLNDNLLISMAPTSEIE